MKISTRTPFCQRRSSLVVSVAALLGWLTACTNVPPGARSSPSAWTLFTDYAGGFSVLMPMRPQESTIEQPSADGPPVKRHQFIVDPDPSIELGVIYNDFSLSLRNIQTVGWFIHYQQLCISSDSESDIGFFLLTKRKPFQMTIILHIEYFKIVSKLLPVERRVKGCIYFYKIIYL